MKTIRQIVGGLNGWRLLTAVLVLVVAGLSLWWGSVNQDEGWYLYAAQMVRDGRMPYRDFFFTQGPALPIVYSALAPIWGPESPLHGLLGGRVVTLALGLLATLAACALARRLVASSQRPAAGLAVFALLAGNLYHVYFTTIPKTYALGSLFLINGFLLLAVGLGLGRDTAPALGRRIAACVASGMAMAFASGTRISLILVLPVVGCFLLVRFRAWRWAFLWFGLGGLIGLFLTYGFFALDPSSRAGLLAAQQYHAARGGFDPFFAIGAVSRLVRGYAALGVVLFSGLLVNNGFKGLNGLKGEEPANDLNGLNGFNGLKGEEFNGFNGLNGLKGLKSEGYFLWMLGLSFGLVFILQLSAPFPYDDYQVPLMGLLTVLIVVWVLRRGVSPIRQAGFAVLAAGMVSASSPMLQQWTVYGQDRFWSHPKERTELSKLRFMAEEINLLDPGGSTLLTQDLYLAVEAGRKVPAGLEMGPFSYFPDLPSNVARARHVMNTEMLEKLLADASANVAAFSGYAFAIAAPKCDEVPFDRQKRFFRILKENYEVADTEPNFGQNATTLLVLRRKANAQETAK